MSEPATAEKPKPRWRRWLLEGLIFALGMIAFQMWQLRDVQRGPAPDFYGQRLDGSHFALADWRAAHPGQPLLLYFWADWCPVCKTTAGSISNIAADWPLTSIAVQSGNADAVSRFMQEKDYRWPTLNDPQGQLLRQYGLPGTPAMVILAPDGNIRFVTVGYTSEIGLRLRLWWASR